eukprot:GHVU01149435.1.p1 GENE.GHVU01149435.1~~GHVU01149435.1.p1  ORF type:complete len:411 (-),score=89.14 GHVU01149435.1:843-2075(-)
MKFHWQTAGIFTAFMVAYCVQPLLVDLIKLHGAAHSSTFAFLIPHYAAMVLVGLLPTQGGCSSSANDSEEDGNEKPSLPAGAWRKAFILSSLDIVNQLLKKAGLVYAGAAAYIVVDSASIVWSALWSRILLHRQLSMSQWLSILLITSGIALKAGTLNMSLQDDEFKGVLLIFVASNLMGATFVLSERFMKGEDPIPGPRLVCMMGTCCSSVVFLWTCFWTVPQFHSLVVAPIDAKGGSYWVVAVSMALLLFAGWVHSSTLWYLIQLAGAVTSGVLKGLKVAVVFCLAHVFFCGVNKSQCLNVWTSISALTCVCGVVLYSRVTTDLQHEHEKEAKLHRADSRDVFDEKARYEGREGLMMSSSIILPARSDMSPNEDDEEDSEYTTASAAVGFSPPSPAGPPWTSSNTSPS